MAVTYKKIGVTTGGYRGERAVLQERVIEGLEQPTFEDSVLRLTDTTPQTIYLTDSNVGEGYIIILPNAQSLWNNWKVSIINNSTNSVNVYYYTEDTTQLNLYKKVTSGNMSTLILLDNSTIAGTWTTLRTTEQSNANLLSKYTTDVYDEIEITYNELKQSASTIVKSLGSVLAGTAIKSVYVKTLEQFTVENDNNESDENFSLKVSIGTGINESDEDYDENHFISNYDLTLAVSNTNFTKDLFNEILSTDSDQIISATFTGTNLIKLVSGRLKIVVEKAKLIDPTILKNPILQTQIPIGVIMNYAFNDLPEGYWRLDGKILPNAATAIPDFVQKLNKVNNELSNKIIIQEAEWQNIKNTHGSCGKFAWAGSGLRFPQITCFIRGLTDLSSLGDFVEDTMRPITGSVGKYFYARDNRLQNGALYRTQDASRYGNDGSGTHGSETININSARLGQAYNGTETQPKHIKYPYIISIYNAFQNSSLIDLDQIIESSVNKANISLDNLTNSGFNVIDQQAVKAMAVNYWSGIDILASTRNDGFIAPKSGLVWISGGATGYVTGTLYAHFIKDVNEATLPLVIAKYAGNYGYHLQGTSVTFMLDKNVTLTIDPDISSSLIIREAYFFPFLGGN